MPGASYALPSDNLIDLATLTWNVGTPNGSYPLANIKTLEPDVVGKANENTATLRATFGVAKTLEAVVAINVSFPGVTVGLTNNGGMATQSQTVGAPEDDLCANVYWDLRGIPGTSATQWNIPVVGSAPVAIGTLLLIESLQDFRLRWGYDIEDRFPVVEARTGHQKRLQYRIPIRYRRFSGVAEWAEDREAIRTLRREAQGSFVPWVLVPDQDDPDVFLVQFAGESGKETYAFHNGRFDDDTVVGIVQQPIDVEEVNAGVALA